MVNTLPISTFWLIQIGIALFAVLLFVLVSRASSKRFKDAIRRGVPQSRSLLSTLASILNDDRSSPDPSNLSRATRSIRLCLQETESQTVDSSSEQETLRWAETTPITELSSLLKEVVACERYAVAADWNSERSMQLLEKLQSLSARYFEARNISSNT